ncbi:PAS domain S-box protein [Methylocystis suflitae]|uniref:PAS domain S-box protein n=1 Tax=Methylocystis suflitae TaxID=2951405 RepID=UPI002108D50E|nr:PAS domain S-box protein [Methylocystis suflitae]MCQ4189007.1 PAS domain S-box protein [Methylocystis suflitae]
MIQNPPARLILDAFDEGLCLLDEAGELCAMNGAAERLTGYLEEELISHPLLTKLEISSRNCGADPTPSSHDPPTAPSGWLEVRLRRKDGSKIDAVCAICPVGSNAAWTLLKLHPREPVLIEGVALRRIKVILEAIFGGMADGLIVIDEGGKIQLFSAGAETLFGYRAEEALGANVKLLMPAPYRDAHDGYLSNYRETGFKKIIGTSREVSGRRKDGSTFLMYLSIGEIWLEGKRYFVGVAHDLTRLKRAEERLITLAAAVEQSPAAVMISNKEGRIEYVNNRFVHLTGYEADELIGQNACLLQSNHTASELYPRLWETICSGSEWRGEIQDRKQSGELYWAQETITPLRDARGEITHFLAIQEDVTRQKQDKEALAESEQRFRHVAEMAGEWLWEQDTRGRYIYSSVAVRDILGLEPEEILGKSYLDLFAGEPPEHWMAELPSYSAENCHPFHRLVNHYRHKDGHDVYTESTGAPIFDPNGELIKWRGVDHDITARKQSEDALRIRNRAIESVHIGIVICDARIPGNPNIYVNPALSRITGYTREELLGHSMNLLQGPETDPAALDEIRRAISKGQSCEVTMKNYRKDGSAFWNELLISPVVDDAGAITHYIGIQTDVTERRKAEESRHELEIAKHIQLSLLPDAPLRLPRVELAGVCLPANHVGGDYFDYFDNSGGVDVVIADVSGHSVGAALIMTEVRSTLRAETRRWIGAPTGPAQVLRDLNELLHHDLTRAELFITMFYFRFLSETRTLKYANAGHNSPLLLRSSQTACTLLDADGLVLGVKRAVEFEERSIELSAGDKLLFYTDGVTEAQNPRGDFFGVDRLCKAFRAHRDLAPETLITEVLADMREFCGHAPRNDDIAMVIMEIS